MLDDKTLEDLRVKEQAIIATYDWWQRNISDKAEQLNNLLEKDEDNFDKVEKLQEEISFLQRKGAIEEKCLKDFQSRRDTLIWNSMLSGLNQIH